MRKILSVIILIIATMGNSKAQERDFDIYPPDSLKGKGILLNMNIEKNAMYDSLWWVSQGSFTLDVTTIYGNYPVTFSKEHPNGYSEVTHDYAFDIPADPFRVCKQDAEHYYISITYPKHFAMRVKEFYSPDLKYLKVRKSQMDSLGFRYVSCEKLLEMYKNNQIYSEDPVGMHILPPLFIKTSEPFSDKMGGFRAPYPYSVFFILKNAPSLDAPYLNIVEPNPDRYGKRGIYKCKVLWKKDYWYKLDLQVNFMFGGVFWDAFYQGDTYTGYWQAPFDSAGFPYLLVDIAIDRQWAQIINRLKTKQ